MSDGQTDVATAAGGLPTQEEQTPADPLSEFVALETERHALEDRLKKIAKQTAVLSEWLVEDWADRGQQNAKLQGRTVYIAQEFYCHKATGVPTYAVCEALKHNGLGTLVAPGYSAQSLKAWVKETIEAEREVPEGLAALLNYETVPRMRSRKA